MIRCIILYSIFIFELNSSIQAQIQISDTKLTGILASVELEENLLLL